MIPVFDCCPFCEHEWNNRIPDMTICDQCDSFCNYATDCEVILSPIFGRARIVYWYLSGVFIIKNRNEIIFNEYMPFSSQEEMVKKIKETKNIYQQSLLFL